MRVYRLTFRSAAIAATVGLAVLLFPSQQADAQDKGKTDPAAFGRGAKYWADNCNRCHNYRDAKDFDDRAWKIIMSHMRIRAGLTGQETRDILKFLQGSN